MNIPCEIIFDLIPLYQEDLCSEGTRAFVEEHLKECSECRKLLENNDKTIFEVKDIKLNTLDEKSVAVFKGMKQKIKKNNMRISFLSAMASLLLIIGVARVYFGQGVPIEEWRISTLTQDQPLGIDLADWPEPTNEEFWTDSHVEGITLLGFNQFFTGANILRRTMEIDGIEKDIIYMNITQSEWDLFWNNLWIDTRAQGEFVINDELFAWESESGNMRLRTFDRQSTNNEIVAIYYLVGDFQQLNRMDNAQFDSVIEDVFLLWENR